MKNEVNRILEILESAKDETGCIPMALVRQALKKLEQRWIPWDSGKFPEESGTYTITAYDGATKRVTYAKYQKRLKRWELTGARAYWRVLAWMPLPKPYREEKR